MINHNYDAILCDLGNVLVNFDHRIAVKKFLKETSKNEEDIYNMFFDSGLTKLLEEGKISSEEFFEKINAFLGLRMPHDEFFLIWSDIFFETPLNKKIQVLLKSVKSKYKLIMVSNINEKHYKFLKERFSFFDIFDSLILSYEVGFRKPAKEIYDAALKAADSTYEKAFYIDDRRDLVEAASLLGIKGVTFNGEEAFLQVKKEISV